MINFRYFLYIFIHLCDADEPLTYYYAIDKTTLNKCHIKLTNAYHHEVPEIGDEVVWYKYKPIEMYEGRYEFCENNHSVEERWLVGLVFITISVFFSICCFPALIHECSDPNHIFNNRNYHNV